MPVLQLGLQGLQFGLQGLQFAVQESFKNTSLYFKVNILGLQGLQFGLQDLQFAYNESKSLQIVSQKLTMPNPVYVTLQGKKWPKSEFLLSFKEPFSVIDLVHL